MKIMWGSIDCREGILPVFVQKTGSYVYEEME